MECGWERCGSIRGYACWVRCFRRALKEHNYIRCGEQTRYLREADIEMPRAPQLSGTEVYFGPAWAVALIKALRQEATNARRRLVTRHVVELLTTSTNYGPTPPAMLARFDELRTFAALRGWRFQHGMWYRSDP